jgi:hypothetical protein
VEIDTCVEEMPSALLEALAASNPKSRPRDDPRPPIQARIQDEIRLKNRLRRQWQITRDPALKAEVNRLQRSVTDQLNEWRNDQWGGTLESLDPVDQSLWKMTRRVMRVSTPSPPLVTPGKTALSDSEKAEALADSLESQFQPVNDPSDPAVIEKVTEVLQTYPYAPASEPNLTNPMEVQDAIQCLKVGKAPGPKGLPNRALKHLPQRAISLLVALFNSALLTQYFPPVWKHARVISILEPWKDHMLVPSHHVELALYADDTAIISTSRKSALLLRYLESYLSDLERWLREWRIAINVSKSNAMLFPKAAWRIPRPRPVHFPGEPIKYSPLLRSDSRFTPDLAASYRTGQEESLPATGCVWLSPKQEKWPLHQECSSAV